MRYRTLKPQEISSLENQGCVASDWKSIRVEESFSPEYVHQTRFSGTIQIGKLGQQLSRPDGSRTTSSLYGCTIVDCVIGNRVLLERVGILKNYRIGDDVIVTDTESLTVVEGTSFGNGVEVDVLNEGGGREVLIYEGLNAQLAYLQAIYRHNNGMVEAIRQQIRKNIKSRFAPQGEIGKGSVIIRSGTIENLRIGEYAHIEGATRLSNGTLESSKVAPARIGDGVIARDFVMRSGSVIDSGALISKCFVGQGVEIGKQFSAENSLFFANCEAFHGEAVSVFAGPYTVTHHKSTLLIAGMYSFYNAGSGTNQSNHMYKLGPVHQGVVERGSKTGSFAYLLWPSRIGPYSVVMGKNLSSFDTSDFPFSYINVDQEKSILTPGMNLFTVGTRRDSEKWPARDKRKDPNKADLINFDFLNPYVMQKVITGLHLLAELYDKASKKQETVFHKGIRIKRLMLRSTQRYYQMALAIFVGQQVIRKLESAGEITSREELSKILSGKLETKDYAWVDMAGLITPSFRVELLCEEIESDRFESPGQIHERLQQMHDSYAEDTWDWTTQILKDEYQVTLEQADSATLSRLIGEWEENALKMNKMILNDAAKEFDEASKIGFGLDGDEQVRAADFEAVRGTQEANKFVAGIRKEMEEIGIKASSIKKMLKNLHSDHQ